MTRTSSRAPLSASRNADSPPTSLSIPLPTCAQIVLKVYLPPTEPQGSPQPAQISPHNKTRPNRYTQHCPSAHPPRKARGIFSSSFLMFIPSIIFAVLSHPLPGVSQIRGHIAGPPPPPHYGTSLHFYREKNSAFSSLVGSRRIVPTHAAGRSRQLILFVFWHFYKQSQNLTTMGIELKDQR